MEFRGNLAHASALYLFIPDNSGSDYATNCLLEGLGLTENSRYLSGSTKDGGEDTVPAIFPQVIGELHERR